MENSEKVVVLNNRSWVLNKDWPVGGSAVSFEFIDDLREIPRESKHIGMLLLWELSVNTDAIVLSFDVISFVSLSLL